MHEKKTGPKINMRITPTLKQRYEDALINAGIHMTQHLTSKILEFVNQEEKRMKLKEETKGETTTGQYT